MTLADVPLRTEEEWLAFLPHVALSIRQPWCWAITDAGKDIENRDWWTEFRGPFLIHASKTLERGVAGDLASDFAIPFEIIVPAENSLPLGGIVGMANLVNCVSRSSSQWFFGRRGFVLQDARPLPFVAAKGALGFYRIEEDVRRELARLLGGGEPRAIDAPASKLQDGPLFSWANEIGGA